jgi:hypothetical protein
MCSRNAALNGMNWVVVEQAAVSDRDGTLQFNCGLNGAVGEISDYAGLFEVTAVTVDTLTSRHGSPSVVFVDVEGFEARVLAGAVKTFPVNPDWFVEVHVGCGLEASGASVEQILAYFPDSNFDRYVHSEGDTIPIPLESAPAEKFRRRFFLTALSRRE